MVSRYLVLALQGDILMQTAVDKSFYKVDEFWAGEGMTFTPAGETNADVGGK